MPSTRPVRNARPQPACEPACTNDFVPERLAMVSNGSTDSVNRGIEEVSRMLANTDFEERPARERAMIAAVGLLVWGGLKAAITDNKTASSRNIAALADITESTLFRYFPKDSMGVVEAGLEWCWSQMIERLAYSDFENPDSDGPQTVLQRDFRAMWGMWDSPLPRLAATGALLEFRRSDELRANDPALDGASSRAKFEARMGNSCARLLENPEHGKALVTILTNYAAAVWFAWLKDEGHRDSPDYRLGPEYASIGLDALLDAAQRVESDVDDHS